MDKYIFGMKAERAAEENIGEFKVYTKRDGGNWNPYNTAYFDNLENVAATEAQGKITSIPSPYARMHLTDLAFREANCGLTAGRGAVALSADYNKALSHCLDIFELMFYADTINLKEKGITIEKIDLVSTNTYDQGVMNYLNGKPALKNYVATLDMFRKEYNNVIQAKRVDEYLFDFTSLYVLKQNGKSFAATSPFTGFYAKSNCDISNITINNRLILNSDPDTWQPISGRSQEFREFMYLLLRGTKLSRIFENLYRHVENSLSQERRNTLDNGQDILHHPAYKKFNFGASPLQQIANQNVYIRPDGLDGSYLKFMLYLSQPVNFNITQSEYMTVLNERQFNGNLTAWLGVNDILADSLFVLTYEINDNYLTVPYTDYTDNAMKKRCLIPVKKEALNYFTIEEICNRLQIVRKDAVTYMVTFTIPLANGGTTVIRREYKQSDDVCYPDGKVFQGDEVKPFAFGIYPFVKASHYTNMYKVLFYNSFKDRYAINFYKRLNGSIQVLCNLEVNSNKTNSVMNPESRVNCEYHDLTIQEGSFEFAEVVVDGRYTSLIVPKLRVVGAPKQMDAVDIQHIPGQVTVAIDLGTSNTYVAYTHCNVVGDGADNIREINTHHINAANEEWNELTFMNKRVENNEVPNAPDKNREDLYLKVSDRQDPVDTWLSAQLNEFIPSRIEPGNTNYSFPIPTVINFLRQDTGAWNIDSPQIPLLNFAIPFAYYERGIRKGAQQYYYDLIKNGSDFKWFMKKDAFGNETTDETCQGAFKAFLTELMFIVRCHLICKGYDLNNCRIIWSYPLSFSSQLRDAYDLEWKNAFRKFISPNVDGNVLYTNESRSPIYDCIENPNAVNQLTLLLDVGGGSTDVIAYKHNEVKFVTSFAFAGNALYLNSALNTIPESQMNLTLLKQYINRLPMFKNQQRANTNGQEMVEERISTNEPISTLMNYGFTKARLDFENIFRNAPARYMLELHNAAIIYHIAQLCKIYSPDELPQNIYFSGNGSKLFGLNVAKDSMIKRIFSYVYDGNNEADFITISNNPNPKAATVHGALKGLNAGTLATNRDSNTASVVMLGDESTVATVDGWGHHTVNVNGDYAENVKNNVIKFFELFYNDLYNTVTPILTLNEIERFVDQVSGDPRLKLPQNGLIKDSLFFQYVALVMQQISIVLAKRGAAGN